MKFGIKFIERVIKLSDMQVGQYAVTRDREKIFVCGYRMVGEGKDKKLEKTILCLNHLTDQYPDNWNMNQLVTLINKDNCVSIQINGEDS